MMNRREALSMLAALPGIACGKVATEPKPDIVYVHGKVLDSAGEGLTDREAIVGVVFPYIVPRHPWVYWLPRPSADMAKNAHVFVEAEVDKRWQVGFRPIRIVSWEAREPLWRTEHYEEVITHDVNGAPIVNSQGEPFYPPVTVTRSRWVRR